MAIFPRRSPVPTETNYTKYRSAVRDDFVMSCCYCLMPELLAGGSDNFELDHFRPKSREEFAHLAHDYLNIYYACHICNHAKAAKWPSEALLAVGYRFLDYCVEVFSRHFELESSGLLKPLTTAAEYTLERLRLNRPHLVQMRLLIGKIVPLARQSWDSPSQNWLVPML